MQPPLPLLSARGGAEPQYYWVSVKKTDLKEMGESTKKQYIGGNWLKRGTWTISRFKREVGEKEKGGLWLDAFARPTILPKQCIVIIIKKY